MKKQSGLAWRKDRFLKILNILLVFEWMMFLKNSDAFYGGYLLLGTIGVAQLLFEKPNDPRLALPWNKMLVGGLSAFFAAAVALANHAFLSNGLQWCMLLYAGWVVAQKDLGILFGAFAGLDLTRTAGDRRIRSAYVFLLSFLLIAAVDIVYLMGWNYPGSLSPDSLHQVRQILTGQYDNHHPYWHTMLMGVFIRLGMALFSDIHAAIALYSVAQIVLMALCFAFAIMTLSQAGLRVQYLLIPMALYAIMPYHVVYSATLWKDVLFGGAMLLMVISLYRVMKDMGNAALNYVLLGIGMLGVALLRNNGWLALLASFVLWIILYRRKWLKVTAVFAAVLAVSWLMKNPVLDGLGVEQSNFRESLSIPMQQIARVVAREGELSDEHRETLSKVIDVEGVAQWYDPGLSDPVKAQLDGEYIRAHKAEFLKLWLEIGLKNPIVYLEAWADQTKGYWNAGYDYWMWCVGVYDNDLGIQGKAPHRYNNYTDIWCPKVCEPLFSLGLHVWALVILFVFNCICGRKEQAYLAIPLVMIWGTLVIATPVFSEFRYAYALFTVLPVYGLLCALPAKE